MQKSRLGPIILLLALGLGFVGCHPQGSDDAATGNGSTTDDRTTAIEQFEIELDGLRREVQELGEELALKSPAEFEKPPWMVEIEQQLDMAGDQLERLKHQTDDTWETARRNLEERFDEIRQAFRDAQEAVAELSNDTVDATPGGN
jgi:hypothetical protein